MSSAESQGGRARIRRLPEAVIDQIAAGEVVERPASVVKELVENALDADSARIRVEVRAGGRDGIAVGDDGWGMSPLDARLGLQRHATSKIDCAEDLARIGTLGFRGEALPAIASVSRLRLRTCARGAAEGCELRVDAGRIVEERATGGPEGTRVEVADLFATVPARRKFLKSVTTEWGHIADWLARSALARPDVHFDIRRDDRRAVVWPAADDPLDRIAAVLSEEDAAAFVPVDREQGALSLGGFVSRPDRHRPTMAGIFWFANRRPVRDRLLQHALIEIYRDLLPRGRFPSAVLFLTLPPAALDVNVHPAKWEVRFADPRAVHRLVRQAVRAAIEERRWMALGGAARVPGAAPPEAQRAPQAGPGDWAFAGQSPRVRGDAESAGQASPLALATDSAVAAEEPGSGRIRLGELKLLGQFLATYLVLEGKEGLLLVDQHAAHERVLYERLRADWRGRTIESQRLLVPATVELEPSRLAALCDRPEALIGLGFDLEAFGEGALALRAVPALLAERDPASLVRDLADELCAAGEAVGALQPGSTRLDATDRIFASLACHGARRKGEVLEPREQLALLSTVDGVPWAPTCPHGRPVVVPIELAEIERRFGRR